MAIIKTDASGNYAGNTSGGYFEFEYTQTKNISENKSTISYTLKNKGGSGGGSTIYSWYLKINGTVEKCSGCPYEGAYVSPEHWETNGHTLASGSFTINHSADGTGSFNLDIGACINVSYWTMNPSYRPDLGVTWDTGNWNSRKSLSVPLDTIPRNPAVITNVSVSNTKYDSNTYIVAGYSISTLTPSVTLGDAPSISSYIVKCNGATLPIVNANPLQVRVPTITTDSSQIVYKVTAIDSYSMSSNEFTCTGFTAYKYTQGSWTGNETSERCLQDGTLDEIGEYAYCNYNFNKAKIGTNEIDTTAKAEITGFTPGTSLIPPLDVIIGNNGLSGSNSYIINYTLSDELTSNYDPKTGDIGVSFRTINLHGSGKSVAFGKKARDPVDWVDPVTNNNVTTGFVEVDNSSMEFMLEETKSTTQNDEHCRMSAGFITGDNQNHGLYSYGYVDSNNQFHSDPMWLIKRDNTGAVSVEGLPQLVNSTATLTRDDSIDSNHNGTMMDYMAYNIKKYGNVVLLEVILNGDGNTHRVGYNVFSGNLSGDRPVTTATGVGYYGNAVLIGNLYTNGNLVVRLSGWAQDHTFGSGNPLYMSWTYLTN